MAAVVGAIIFAALFLLLIGQQSDLLESVNHHDMESTYIQNSASEMAQFYAASIKFLSGFGVPSNGEYITVSDLKKSGLLPGAFPDFTPFGFELEGWPISDPNNNSITDLTIISVAPHSSNNTEIQTEIDDLSNTGFGLFTPTTIPVGDVQEIDEEVVSLLTPTLLSQYAGNLSAQSQSLTIGHTATNNNGDLSINTGTNTVKIADTGISASVLPSYQSSSPAIEVVAPNQLGYTVFSYSGYFYGVPWQYLYGASLNNSLVSSADIGYVLSEPSGISLANLGWSPTCPESNDIIHQTSSQIFMKNDVINTAGDPSLSGLMCFRSYRSEQINLSYTYNTTTNQDGFFGGGSYSINGGQGGSSSSVQPYQYTGGKFVNQPANPVDFSYSTSSSSGSESYDNVTDLPFVNNDLVLGYASTAAYNQNGNAYYPSNPQNNFWAGTVPTLFANIGINFTVLQPKGSTGAEANTYQILLGAYQLPTGQGDTWHQLGLPNPVNTQTGATGIAQWNNAYTIWRGFCMGYVNNNQCTADAFTSGQRQGNVFSENNRNLLTGLGTSDVTTGWFLKVTPELNTGVNGNVNGGTVNNLPYAYTESGNQYTENFNATIPSTAMCNDNYQSGQSGNCPGYNPN